MMDLEEVADSQPSTNCTVNNKRPNDRTTESYQSPSCTILLINEINERSYQSIILQTIR